LRKTGWAAPTEHSYAWQVGLSALGFPVVFGQRLGDLRPRPRCELPGVCRSLSRLSLRADVTPGNHQVWPCNANSPSRKPLRNLFKLKVHHWVQHGAREETACRAKEHQRSPNEPGSSPQERPLVISWHTTGLTLHFSLCHGAMKLTPRHS